MGSAAEVACTEVAGAESDCVVVVVVKNEAACMRAGELVCTDVVTTNVGSRIEFCTKLASWVEVLPGDIRDGVGSILAGSDAGNCVSPWKKYYKETQLLCVSKNINHTDVVRTIYIYTFYSETLVKLIAKH